MDETYGNDDFVDAVTDLALNLNESDCPQKPVDGEIRRRRLVDANERRWTKARTASACGFNPSYIKQMNRTESQTPFSGVRIRQNLLAIVSDGMKEGDSIDVLSARSRLNDRYAKANPSMVGYSPVPTDETMVKILDEGLRQGLFTELKVGRSRTRSIFTRTGAPCKWARARTKSEKAQNAYTAGAILREMRGEDTVVLCAELGISGLSYLTDYIVNPTREYFEPFWSFIKLHDAKSKARAALSSVSTQSNFGTLMALASATEQFQEDSGIDALSWAIAHFAIGLSEIWQVRLFLDAEAQEHFKANWKKMVAALKSEVHKAERESASDPKRRSFSLTFGFSNLR